MVKKLAALVCTLVILACALASGVVAPQAAENTYLVGYSRVDINPYIDPTLTGSALVAKDNIMDIPLYGSGEVWERLSTKGLVDDNGDGKVDENDGLKVTCICVTDASGKTVLLITIDVIAGMMVNDVREAIMTRVQQEMESGRLDNVILTSDQIYYAGTHTHNAPAASVYSASGKTGFNTAGMDLKVVNENLGIWIDRTVANTAEAVIQALKDRAPAKLVKDQISTGETTTAAVKGKIMNSVRHYNNYDSNGNLICVAGDNFNDRGSNPKQVTQVDDTMYLLQFDFAAHNAVSTEDKTNILLVNWRGHPSLNNTNDYKNGGRNCVSSDYVNSFRYALEYGAKVSTNGSAVYSDQQTMRVAFFNGAGGNVNPRGREVINSKTGEIAGQWIDDIASANKTSRGVAYGRILSAMAQEGLKSPAYRETVQYSNIETTRYILMSERKDTGVTALGYEAAVSFQAEYEKNKNIKMPYIYTAENGEVYVISSRYHANSIVSNWDLTYNSKIQGHVDMELNAMRIGENLTFVTSSGELFDYYFNEDGSNAWKNLNSTTYGTPFVIGYCNGFDYYVANNKAYDYNMGSKQWALACYEVSTSQYARGTGERMIDMMDKMLQHVCGDNVMQKQAYCEHCQETVTWTAYKGSNMLKTGHYFLLTDESYKQLYIDRDQQVCFDLNGYTYKGETRGFYTYSNGGATLNLMDSSAEKTGKVIGCGGNIGGANGYGGGTILLDVGNTMNLYGGTITSYESSFRGTQTGGAVRIRGTLNMYGGVITGGVVQNFTGTYIKGEPVESNRNGVGATAYIDGTANIYGGRIENGVFRNVAGTVTTNNGIYQYAETVTQGEGKTPGVYVTGKLMVAGNAYVEDVYYSPASTSRFTINTEEGPFAGYVRLGFSASLGSSLRFGSCTEDTVLLPGTVEFADFQLPVAVNGTGLYLVSGAAVVTSDGTVYYNDLAEAVEAYGTDGYIKLFQSATSNLALRKNLYLDLNGQDISGKITVSSGKTLYCMDTQTDDYSVNDDVFGRLTGTYSGTVKPVPAGSVGSSSGGFNFGYMMITDAKGVSFHRVKVSLTNLSLRPSAVGVYYTGAFAGDERVREKVLEYGVALNAYEEPSETNIKSGGSSICVSKSGVWDGNAQVVGAMLQGIMKAENAAGTNQDNANQKIYGRAYIKTESGYIFSDTAVYSLRQLIETVDEYGNIQGSGISEMTKMYETYRSVMDTWNLPRLRMQMGMEE